MAPIQRQTTRPKGSIAVREHLLWTQLPSWWHLGSGHSHRPTLHAPSWSRVCLEANRCAQSPLRLSATSTAANENKREPLVLTASPQGKQTRAKAQWGRQPLSHAATLDVRDHGLRGPTYLSFWVWLLLGISHQIQKTPEKKTDHSASDQEICSQGTAQLWVLFEAHGTTAGATRSPKYKCFDPKPLLPGISFLNELAPNYCQNLCLTKKHTPRSLLKELETNARDCLSNYAHKSQHPPNL